VSTNKPKLYSLKAKVTKLEKEVKEAEEKYENLCVKLVKRRKVFNMYQAYVTTNIFSKISNQS